ncbi:MAG TPA: ATP-binding protein [Puia sp.]|nr:ATP-binding protein [Puia sp.]
MKLATQIFLGFLIAISIDLLDSLVNYTLTLKVKRISEFLNRSEVLIRHSHSLDGDMLHMQSAFRGFLLTGDIEFLADYHQEQEDVPRREKDVRGLVSLPGEASTLDSIQSLYGNWVAYADRLIEARKRIVFGVQASRQFNSSLHLEMMRGIGKEYNSRISGLFRSLNGIEYQERDLRRKELAEAIERTDRYSVVFSILLVSTVLLTALFLVRKISRRIGSLVRLAERISRGDFGRVADDKRDELTSLSVSLNAMSERLSRTIGELEKKNAELNQFAYVVSHDLKAPVRGISNVVRWIEEDHAAEISPAIREYLDFIPERITRMEGLIDGLLEYARAGREAAVKETVDAGVLVGELGELIVPKECVLLTGNLPVMVTERLPLQQVLSNLISNAVKYGPVGATVIEVSAVDLGTHYEFTVQDNGPGIEPEYHEKIFGLFQTLRKKADKESTGIGLSIVKKIVEERGGTVRLVSSPGNGAKFIFTWPKNN